MSLWTADKFLEAVDGRASGPLGSDIEGVSIDSRTVKSGDAFFAVRGDRFDGHDYAGAALASGAVASVVTEGRGSTSADAPGLLVEVADEPLRALERLGAAGRDRCAGRILAVTGSVGKTSTKEMLRTAFSAFGVTHAPVGSFNNHWGVPLTLARMPAQTAYGIFEIGMNHPGEIRPLTAMVRPEVAIVTTVEPVHLWAFSGEEGIAEAKAEIFEGLQRGGTAILNRDNRWFDLLSKRARARQARIISFGESEDADVRLTSVALDQEGSNVEASVFRDTVAYRLRAPGRHMAANSLAVLAAAVALDADPAAAALTLEQFRPQKGRGDRLVLAHPAGAFTLIDESYNANPASVRAALALLGQAVPTGPGRRVAVLGDMRELGPTAPDLHRGLAQPLADAGTDLVFLVGPEMRWLWEHLPEARRGAYAETGEELEPILLESIGAGDVVVIKASLGTRLGPLVEAIKSRFAPDTEVKR